MANGMATEQALQTLGMSLAARSLVRLEGAELPKQDGQQSEWMRTVKREGEGSEGRKFGRDPNERREEGELQKSNIGTGF